VAPTPPVRGRVRPNAATRIIAAVDAAFARRDMAALTALVGPSYEESDHRTGATWDQQGALDSFRRFMRSRDPEYCNRPLATLGDTLMLNCRWVAAAGSLAARFDVGPYESEAICLTEVDPQGLVQRQEVFAPGRLGDAIVRLYERHAELLPEGPARVRAAATARAVATFGRSATDPDRFAAALAPEIVAVDHRTVGFGELCGRDVVVAAVRALLELSEDVTWRHEELLALSEHAGLNRVTQLGRSRASGGEWARPICTLSVHDADGLIARWEIFEAEQVAAALARYDALVGEPGEPTARAPSAEPFANAATRVAERFVRATAARDWQAVAALYAPSLRFDDRRPLLRMELPKESYLEQLRVLFDVPNARWITTVLATRGEHVALSRLLLQGDVAGGGGALEIDHLGVLEVDDDGRFDAVVLFEPMDLDAAYVELDARWQAVRQCCTRASRRTRAPSFARSRTAIGMPSPPSMLPPSSLAIIAWSGGTSCAARAPTSVRCARWSISRPTRSVGSITYGPRSTDSSPRSSGSARATGGPSRARSSGSSSSTREAGRSVSISSIHTASTRRGRASRRSNGPPRSRQSLRCPDR